MDTFLAILALLLAVVGVAGCILPVLPGTPICYVGMLLMACTEYSTLSKPILITFLIVTILVSVADYLLPAWLSRRFGGSKHGARGATIGMLVGLFMGPMGLLLGPFVGAVLGEMSVNRDDSAKAIRVGFGAFLSFIVGTGIKMIASIAMLVYIIGDMGGIFMGWGDSLGAWWTTVVEWFARLFS